MCYFKIVIRPFEILVPNFICLVNPPNNKLNNVPKQVEYFTLMENDSNVWNINRNRNNYWLMPSVKKSTKLSKYIKNMKRTHQLIFAYFHYPVAGWTYLAPASLFFAVPVPQKRRQRYYAAWEVDSHRIPQTKNQIEKSFWLLIRDKIKMYISICHKQRMFHS